MSNLETNAKYRSLVDRRPHTYSDWDHQKQGNIQRLKALLVVLAIRELPLRHFYARAAVVGVVWMYLVAYHWRYFQIKVPPEYYWNDRDIKEYQNYPLLYEYVWKRITPKAISPVVAESDFWWIQQFPVFYQHHFKSYRYILRNRRVVPWDGTYNQPIFPYFNSNNRTLFVHNGCVEQPLPSTHNF